ncbi:MAG: DUF1194 domain-containing protein [Proteobacteria bacterium]|nr:DUF1194 domain-containing protein [Pseudomonadota bacterium]
MPAIGPIAKIIAKVIAAPTATAISATIAALIATVVVLLTSPVRAAEPVDLLLVLAADVSRSVDARKFQLQREGYAAAIADPRVLAAVRSGPRARIAVCYLEWSGAGSRKLVIDWTVIDDDASARRFGDQLVEAPRSFADRTSISGGIEFAMEQFERAPYAARRRTIDVSGDGTNNSGRDVAAARDEALAKGVTINGLVILSDRPLSWNPEHTNPPGGLAKYYRDQVIGGPGAFVMVAENFESFGRAVLNKLIAEIAMAPHVQQYGVD